jgi:hypothetical protein
MMARSVVKVLMKSVSSWLMAFRCSVNGAQARAAGPGRKSGPLSSYKGFYFLAKRGEGR